MEIIKWIEKEMKKEHFLQENFSKLIKIKVKMGGNVLFEDEYIESIHYYFDTPLGEKIYDDFYDIIQLLHEVRSEGFRIYDYETKEFYVEYDQIMKIIVPIEEKIEQKIMDYYIDYIHDYATGELKDFVLEK